MVELIGPCSIGLVGPLSGASDVHGGAGGNADGGDNRKHGRKGNRNEDDQKYGRDVCSDVAGVSDCGFSSDDDDVS